MSRVPLMALVLFAVIVAPGHAAATTVAGWGHGAGRVNGPRGVAVDQWTGDLYVADGNNLRIDRFDSEGNFLLAWGAGVADGESPGLQACGLVGEPPTRRCFKGLFSPSSGDEVVPQSVVVDNDVASPSYQDVYVAELNPHRVSKFTPSGALLFRLGPDITYSGPGDAGADETQTLTVKATAGAFTLELKAPAPFGQSSATQTTAPIPFDASHEEVQAALEALPNVEAGDLTVSGGPGDATGSTPYEIHFTGGPYAGNYVAPIKAGSGGLSGSVAVATSVPGGGPEVCEPGRGDVCKAAEGSGAIPGELNLPNALAFDGEGKLWVNDNGKRVQRFDADGAFLEEVPLPAGTRAEALAIDSTGGDLYVLGPQGHNERQFVRVPTNLEFQEHGEFTLSFEGETTAPISSVVDGAVVTEAGAKAIQEALEALSAIGPGNVRVEKHGSLAFDVAFTHDLGGRDVPQLGSSTIVGSPPVTVETNTQGNPGSVERLDSGGALLETLDDDLGDLPQALATDAAGNLYVGDAGSPYHLLRYDSTGDLSSVFAAGQVIGSPTGNALAVDEGSETHPPAIYTASSNSAESFDPQVAVQRFDLPAPGPLPAEAHAEDILPTSATLAATLNPEGAETHYRFQYLTEEAYEEDREAGGDGFEGAGVLNTTEEVLPGAGYEDEEVSAEIEGLIPATAYRFRILAENEDGEAEAQASFATRTAVGIEAQWASDLSANDATLDARLDPLGVEATWWLEYGTSSCAAGGCAKAPGGVLPAGFGEVPVAVALRGLAPSTAYRYRFVATDTREGTPYTTYGDEQTLTTQPAGLGFSLPDSRAWEMVSPPDKHGGRITTFDQIQGGPLQAAANGEALAYLSYGSLEAAPQGNRIIEQSSELARRGAGGAWSSEDITPPHSASAGLKSAAGLEYKLFSTNLERALLDPHAPVQISPYATEDTPYLRENSDPPTYTPLAVGCPPEGEPCPAAVREHEDVAAGTAFGGELKAQGASPDLSHVALQSSVPLAKGAAVKSLYVWSGGALQPLSVPPGAESPVAAELGAGEASTRGAISEDGSRIFWSAAAGGLYMSDSARGEAVQLDEVRGGFGTGAVAPRFQGASADGSVAFFSDTQNLTEDANEEGADLYRWRAQGTHGCEAPGGCLADLTAEVADFGEFAEVQGTMPGTARDGSRAYFVARGVLDTRANPHGEIATSGQPNLYTWSEGGGTRFVATLSGEDSTDWAAPWSQTAEASPSGRYLAFMSSLPLSGYDNRDAAGGERAEEVFRYDAQSEELACVSCDPGGARPRAGVPGPGGGLPEEFDPQHLWWGKPVAAVVPEASKLEAGTGGGAFISAHAPRYVEDDGRVFFNAVGSLVPADSNGTADVYEQEPLGAGTCTASSGGAGTAVVPGGCVSLISGGTPGGASAFLDASEEGTNVFFYSPARLSAIDVDDELDIYDARVNGEPASLEPSAECLGEACQPPATPPPYTQGATATHHGPGNVRARKPRRRCPKGRRTVRRHGKARCVKKHRRARRHRHHRHKRRHGARSHSR